MTEHRIRLFFLLICTLFLTGCVAKPEQNIEKLNIVTTIFPLYDFIREVGGEYAEVKMLLPPGMESHSYEPSPKDMIAVVESDLFFYIGGESDVWIEELLDSTKDIEEKAYALMPFVEALEEEDGEYDEHIWTSPKNAKLLVNAIRDKMMKADSSHAIYYQENAEMYVEKLDILNEDIIKTISEGKRKTLLFGDRFPFLYFAKEYGLTCYAAFPGCSSETEPSAATLRFLVDKVKEDEIPVIFYLELSNHKIADVIAEMTGARALRFHSCHNVTKEEMKQGVTYLSLMRENLEHLKEAL